MTLLMRPEPFTQEFDRLFGSLFEGRGREVQRWVPAMDLVEADDHFVLRADLPGLAEDDVAIEVQDNVLTISGSREAEHERKEQGWYRLERSYGSFSRSFQLPQGVDEDSIEASFENGLLRLRVPKAALPQPRRIEIQGSQKSERGSQQQISGSPRSEGSNARKNGSSEPKARGEQGDQKGRGETTERSRGEQTDRTRGEMAASSNR